MTSDVDSSRWKWRPIMGGLMIAEAMFRLGRGTAVASVAPDFDWPTNGVLYGVTFRRYVPKVETDRDGLQHLPAILPERKLSFRMPVQGNDPRLLQLAMKEAMAECEKLVRTGRPPD